MALTAALKAQIAAWYKALQQQIPDFIPRAPQRQMIADVAKTLAGDEGRHLAIEAPTGVGKTLSYLIPGIAIAREEQKTLVVSTANVALQDQIYSKDLPLLRKIIPELRFTAAFGRGRYVCPRNLAALSSSDATQQDLLAFLDDELTPNNKAEQDQCAKLKADLDSYKWDGLRDHTDQAIGDDLWRRLSTDKASCLNRNCHYYRECPFFVARREIQEAEVVVANHALVMAAMESEAVLPDPKNLLLVLDEGHHLPDVARDALEMSAEITAPWFRLQLDLFCKLIATCMEQFRPKTIPPLAVPERLSEHCETVYTQIASLNNILDLYLPATQEAEHRFAMGELPEEVMTLCKELAKHIEKLRGLAELFLNDLSEKTGSHDVVRVHRVLLQMNRALGMFEGQSKLWRLASMVQASGAPVTKWATRIVRDGQIHLHFHCVGIRVSDQLEKLLWRSVPHVVVTSATLRSLNSFSRLQGEAQFAFPIPYEQAAILEKNSKLELVASPSIMQRYISMNVTQKPFDNPKVREAINYAINRQALVKVAFAGYATPATGVLPPSIAYSQSYQPWPYDPAKARELLKEAGFPNGFSTTLWSSHNHSTAQKVLQFTQQQLAQVGIKVQVTAMDAGQRAAEVEGKGQKESGVRMFYTGWSASTGEADWALSPLFASQNWPPTLFNTAFYSNPQVDKDLSDALKTTKPDEKARLYKDAQDTLWKESPWVPLVVEKLVSAHNKALTGFYIMPDTGFSFDDADLK
jgi:Rad3-related DNA helicase